MTNPTTRGRAARAELAGAALRDARLSARLERVAERVASRAGESLPRASGSISELEATYRFLNNDKVTPGAVLEPHVRATAARTAQEDDALVVHDTTELDFGKRPQLGLLTGERRGFLGHFSIVVSSDGERRPLGVVNIEPVFREAYKGKGKRAAGKESEAARWYRGVDASAQALGERKLTHVMDREGDSAELLQHLLTHQRDFVIRSTRNRHLVGGGRMHDVLSTLPVLAHRDVELSERARHPSPRHRRRHPPRDARQARVEISAGTIDVMLQRTSAQLSVVVVTETQLPHGQSPVQWVLWTTLPVRSEAEVLRVVDIYRARWVIEEYFRVLKSGCAYESLQLESRHGLLNALAIFATVAWVLLHLRTVARTASSAPPTRVVSKTQLVCLRLAFKMLQDRELPLELTARDVMLAIARLGGHLPQNGEPGWIVLGRGLHDLLMIELGYRSARGEM